MLRHCSFKLLALFCSLLVISMSDCLNTSAVTSNSLSLNGSSAYMSAANSSSLNITTSITVEAWIKTNSTAQQGIVERYGSTGNGGYALRIASGGYLQFFDLASGSSYDYIQSTVTISAGVWHHVAGEFDGSQLRVYIDGTQRGSKSSTFAPGTGTNSVKVGARGDDAATKFNGLIDEVRITAAAVYTGAFVPFPDPAAITGTKALWKFDGQTTNDSSGNTNTGTLTGGATYSTDAPNKPPTVSIASPANGAVFIAPANITVTASASDIDGTVASVEFYQAATLIGTATSNPYTITWTNVAVGNYSLTAKAIDNLGANTTSSAISITVNATNTPPSVSLTSPSNNAAFSVGSNISVTATASDVDGTVTQVEFYQGTTLIGTATTSPYSVVWNNVPLGTYSLTAKATDNLNATTTSSSVNISVVAGPAASITSPANNASLTAGTDIVINVTASESGATISKVEFFQGATKLGETITSPFSFTWSTVPAASYVLTARATDNFGITGTSSPVNISVTGISYVYDELGRLASVIDREGNAAAYNYDAVGNLLSISRFVSTQTSIIRFSPLSGVVGASVTIYGTGFSAIASQNTVTFNGIAATITASSPSSIVTSVPTTAATGPIVVTSPIGSATSSTSFIVGSNPGAPTIAGFAPTIGTVGTAVTISGTNFDTTAANDRATFNTVNSTISSAAAASINTAAPMAGSGHISVTTPAGKATSSGDFFIPPSGYAVADVVSTGRMSIGGSSTVSVNTASKIGLMLFDGTQGQRIYLDITNVNAQSNAYVNIYNPDGTQLASTTISFSTPGSTDTVAVPATGTYSIMLAPWGTGTASATFTLYNVPPDFTSAIVPSGAALTATVTAAGQNARLTFSGTAGQLISLNVTAVTIAGVTPVTIYNPNGTTFLSLNIDITHGGWIDATALPATGTYTILVNPAGTATGNATLALYNVMHISGSISPGGAAVPVSINTPGQNATYTFSGTAGQQVSLNITNVSFTGSNIYIQKPDATTLISTFAGTSGNFIDKTTLPISGTYMILVDPTISNTGTLTLNLYNAADFTGSITPGGAAVTINITSPGQNAVLSFSGAAGQKISLNVTAVTITSTTSFSIRKPDGSSLAASAFGASGVYMDTQILPTTGTYTIVVDPYYNNIGNATFTLYDCSDVTGTITPGGPAVNVTISVLGQSARLTFTGAAGHRVSLNVTNNTIFSSYIDFYNPDGSVLGASTLISNSSTAFIEPRTTATSGTYAIVVNPNNTNTGSLTLTLYDVPADPAGTVTVGGAGVGVTTTVAGQNASLTFSGTSGQQVTVRVTSNTMSTVTVKLLKPDGSTLTSSTSSSASFNLAAQTLPVTGTYTVSIDPSGANTGSVTVSVTSP